MTSLVQATIEDVVQLHGHKVQILLQLNRNAEYNYADQTSWVVSINCGNSLGDRIPVPTSETVLRSMIRRSLLPHTFDRMPDGAKKLDELFTLVYSRVVLLDNLQFGFILPKVFTPETVSA